MVVRRVVSNFCCKSLASLAPRPSVSCLSLRVLVTTSKANKHTLPVYASCAFSHGIGIGLPDGEAEGVGRQPPCTFEDGSPVNNQDDLWRCMHEAHCDITDDWIQMAVFRDPRPAIVSTFYHIKLHAQKEIGTLEAFVARELPISCQWLAVRHILFAGTLADQSIEVWYNDAMNDPLGWHYHWFYSVGLQLPFHIVEATAQAAAADDLGFKHKPIDLHPGEELRGKQGLRQFEDEVSTEILAIANDVLRTWLPPVLLERFGVEP